MPEPALPSVLAPFVALLREEAADLLRFDEPLWLTRAPGKVELLGGPGETPGSACLTLPLRRSVYCAIQNIEGPEIRILHVRPAAWGGSQRWEGEISTLYTKKGPPRSLAVLNQTFAEPGDRWMMRVIAAMLGLRRTRQLNTPKHGFHMIIWSRLPGGSGLGDEAAFGTAVALACKGATGLAKKRVDGRMVARAVVQGAREVLGEEIPMADALTAALGRRNCALFIEHGLDPVMQWVPVPQQVAIGAVDMGWGRLVPEERIAHADLGARMGLFHLNAALRKAKESPIPGWGSVSPGDFEDEYRKHVPADEKGADWLKRFRRTRDAADLVPLVDPETGYRERAFAEHQVRENSRVRRMVANLSDYARTLRENFLAEAGRCLLSSHRSLSEKLKFDVSRTDAFLEAFKAKGREEGFFGLRLAECGRHGILAALVHQSSRLAIRELAEEVARAEGGPLPTVILDSEDGGVLAGWWEGVVDPREVPETVPGDGDGAAGDSAG